MLSPKDVSLFELCNARTIGATPNSVVKGARNAGDLAKVSGL